MDVGDLAACFVLQRDLSSGLTLLRDFAGTPNEVYVGISNTWNADPSKAIWYIFKNTFDATNTYNIKTQVSPPTAIWNNRASIFP